MWRNSNETVHVDDEEVLHWRVCLEVHQQEDRVCVEPHNRTPPPLPPLLLSKVVRTFENETTLLLSFSTEVEAANDGLGKKARGKVSRSARDLIEVSPREIVNTRGRDVLFKTHSRLRRFLQDHLRMIVF